MPTFAEIYEQFNRPTILTTSGIGGIEPDWYSNIGSNSPLTPATYGGGTPRDPKNAKEPATVVVHVEPLESAFVDEYRALVADLGMSAVPLDTERFKAFVVANGLTVYNRADVDEYLHHKYALVTTNVTARVVWGYRPLRELDRTAGHTDSANGHLQRGAPAYSKPIPYPVLLTVKAIRDAFPAARFFVSDEMHAERIPDPFLLVEIGSEQFIVERWDEPSFRERRADK
jgi:hypothetical protein